MTFTCSNVKDELHLFSRTDDGVISHAYRQIDGTWEGFNKSTKVVIAGKENKSISSIGLGANLHLFLLKTDGAVAHCFYQPSARAYCFHALPILEILGDDNALLTSTSQNNELHLLALKGNGELRHVVCDPDGKWKYLYPLPIQDRNAVCMMASCIRADELHLFLLDRHGEIIHGTRQPDGNWNGLAERTILKHLGHDNVALACAVLENEVHLCVKKFDGTVTHTLFQTNGTWCHGALVPNDELLESSGHLSICPLGSEMHLCLSDSSRAFLHNIRTKLGIWNGFRFGNSLLDRKLMLHVKILAQPICTVDTMLANMREIYADARIRIDLLSTENLEIPFRNGVHILNDCPRGQTTADQNGLFNNRTNVGEGEIVVYFVAQTQPPYWGCAAHPPDRPGAIVTQGAGEWTLAHEVGHVLGLEHLVHGVDRTRDFLMHDGTANLTNPPPDLSADDIRKMRDPANRLIRRI